MAKSLAGKYSADDLNKISKQRKTNTGSSEPEGKMLVGKYSAEDLDTMKPLIEKWRRQKALTEREPMQYGEGDALTNPLYLGKGSTWKGAEPFANLNKLNVYGSQMAPERREEIGIEVELKQIEDEIAALKKENEGKEHLNYYTPDGGNAEEREQYNKNQARIEALEQQKKAKEWKYSQLKGVTDALNEQAQVQAISRKGDEALFERLFDIDYSEKGGRLATAFLSTQGVNGERQYSNEEWNKIAEELTEKGYDVNKAYAAYKNDRLRRETEAESAQFREFASEHPVGATALSIATAPIRGTAGVIGAAMEPGQENSPFQLMTRYGETVTDTVGKSMEATGRALGNMLGVSPTAAEHLGTAFRWMYNAGSSALESRVAMATGGKLGELMLATSAAAQAYNEQLSKGATTGQALATGVASGIFEALFEHLSLERLRVLQASDLPGLKTAILNIAKQFFTEGSEEVATDIANEIWDYLANGGLSNYQQTMYSMMDDGKTEGQARTQYVKNLLGQLLESGVVGGLSGAMGGGWIQGGKLITNTVRNVETGRAVQNLASKTAGGVQEVLSPLAGESDQSRALTGITEKTGAYKTGKLVNQAFEAAGKTVNEQRKAAARQTNVDTLAEAIVERGEAGGNYDLSAAKDVAAAYLDLMSGTKQGRAQTLKNLMTLGNNSAAVDTINEVLTNGRYNALENLSKAIEDAARENSGTAKWNKLRGKILKWADNEKVTQAEETGKTVAAADEAIRTENTEKVDVKPVEVKTAEGSGNVSKVIAVTDGDIEVQVDESGATEKLSNIDFEENTKDLKTYETLRDMMTGKDEYKAPLDVTAANLALSLAQSSGMSGQAFLRQFYSAYVAGTVLANRDTLGVNEGYTIPDEVVDVAYKAGAKHRKANPGTTNVSRMDLSSVQKAEIVMLDDVMRKLGLEAIYFSELKDEELRNGKSTTYSLYGNISSKEKTLLIALRESGQENILTLTAGHEAFHWIGEQNKQAQQALINYVIEYLKSRTDIDYDEIYEQRAALYPGRSRAYIEEEIAAQYFGTIWAERGFQTELARKDRTLAEKLIDHIREFLAQIHERLTKMADRTGDKAMKAALTAAEKDAQYQMRAFEAALQKALETQAKGTQETRESRALDQAADELYEARQEVFALENKVREIEHSDEFSKQMDALYAGLKGDNYEEALEKYNEYAEKSGYAELTAKLADARARAEAATNKYNETYDLETAETERAAVEKSGLTEAEYFKKAAIKQFGRTTDWREAGYMTEDGGLLNFSGEKNRHTGDRGQDHRGIGIIFENTHGSAAMYRFMRYGNIRVISETPGIDLCTSTEPTAQQYAKIKDMVRRFAGEKFFNVDLTDENGRTAGALEYEGNVSADRVVNDIKHYFETGEIREQSNIDKFRYSKVLDQAYDDAVETGDEAKQTALVEQAAKAAGYNLHLYHGAKNGGGFTVFKAWQYFTGNKEYAKRYAKRDQPGSLYDVFVKADRMFDTRRPECRKIYEQYRKEFGMGELMQSGLPDWTDGYDISYFIEENELPYDGIVLDEGGDMTANGPVSRGPSYVIRQSNQIKSAEPITYNDEGNVIPLSERFNPEKTDIRYSRALNSNAVEYVDRLKAGSRQRWEMIDVLEDLAEKRRGKKISDAELRRIATAYAHGNENAANIRVFADRLRKAYDLLQSGANLDTVLYGLYRIAEDELTNAGTWDLQTWVREFRAEFRENGKPKSVYIPENVRTDVTENYGGPRGFRRMMFGKLNIVYEEGKAGTTLDQFYRELQQQNKYDLPETTDPTTKVEALLQLYNADEYVMTDKGTDLEGETLDEAATDEAFGMLGRLLKVDTRQYEKVQDKLVQIGEELEEDRARRLRLDRLQREIEDDRRQGIREHITNADVELNKRLAELSQSGRDSVSVEIERERLEMEYRVKALREAYMERAAKLEQAYREKEQIERLRADAKADLKALSERFTKEKDSNAVPQALKKTVLEFLNMFGRDRSLITVNTMHRLLEFGKEVQENDRGDIPEGYEQLYGRFDEDIRADIEELTKSINTREEQSGRRVYTSQLTLDEMKILANTAAHIRYLVESANEAWIEGKNRKISEIGDRIISEAKAKTTGAVKKLVRNTVANDFLTTKMLTPIYFFDEKIGGAMREVYEGFRDGQDQWYRRTAAGKDVIRAAKDKYHYKDWKNDTVHFTFGATQLRDVWDVDLPVEAMLQIYATTRREQESGKDTKHLTGGGVILGEELAAGKGLREKLKGLTEKGVKAKIEQAAQQAEDQAKAEKHLLSWEELVSIGEKLTQEQRDYADTLVKYMSTDVAAWGNDATMKLSGIKKFNEKYYFPFQSAKNYLYTRLGVSDDTRLKNAGFTKRVVYGAKTPLVVSGFTSVAANHMQQMALFSSMTVPIDTLQRLVNYQPKVLDEEGNQAQDKTNLKTAISDAYGKSALSYINNFVTQVNGGIRTDNLDNLWNRGTSIFKRSAVMGNASVVIQQPTALMRAMAMVDPKYFFGRAKISDYKDMIEHAPIAGVKEMGGFDTMTGRGAAEWMIDEQKPLQKAGELWGKGAEIADAVTWTNIWNACKRETRAKHKDVEYGSDRFYELAYKRFRDVCDYTQVYDSTLSKSELMRGTGALTKMVTAFMAEPTLSFNLLTQSGMKSKGRTINKGAAMAAFVANIIVNGAFKSIVGAWRDKDEDETYFEKWLKRLTGDIVGDKNVWFLDGAWSPFGMIPWIKDVISLWQGYDVDRSDVSVVSDVKDAIEDFIDAWKNFDGKVDEPDVDALLDLVGALSMLTPVPVTKILQDARGITNTIINNMNRPMETTFQTARQAIIEGLGYEKSAAEAAYDAVIDGDAEYIRRQTQPKDGKTEEEAMKTWQNRVKSGIVAKDARATSAAEARYMGDYTRYENLVNDMVNDGLPRDAVIGAVESIFTKLLPDEDNSSQPKPKTMYTTKDLDNALEQMRSTAYWDAGQRMIEAGMKDEKALIKKASDYAKDYYYDTADYNKAMTYLTDFAKMSRTEAAALLEYWKYDSTHEGSVVTQSQFEKYGTTGLKDKGITLEQYAALMNVKNTTRGDDLNNDGKTDTGSAKKKVLKYIDSLNISSTQKDAMYRACGYGETQLKDAPWH